MKIAILGWGSLLWERHDEFDRWHEPWQYDGPTLKIEFSRVSESRLCALTLVIDPDHGTPTTVAWCLSKRVIPEDAVCDLRSREGTTLENISRLTVTQQATTALGGEAEDMILVWARTNHLDAVIWTALKSNFQKKTKQPFSLGAATAHVKRLPTEAKVKAAEYVWRAPDFVQTPLRVALQKEPWF
jgi:hypothetical protein